MLFFQDYLIHVFHIFSLLRRYWYCSLPFLSLQEWSGFLHSFLFSFLKGQSSFCCFCSLKAWSGPYSSFYLLNWSCFSVLDPCRGGLGLYNPVSCRGGLGFSVPFPCRGGLAHSVPVSCRGELTHSVSVLSRDGSGFLYNVVVVLLLFSFCMCRVVSCRSVSLTHNSSIQ